MEKKLISVHAVTIHIYTVAIVLLIALLGVLGLKYLHLKMAVKNYTQSAIYINNQAKPNGYVSEYAIIVARGVNQIPVASLQTYVEDLSKTINRDIVVLDKSQKILAHTISTNKGKAYGYGMDEIRSTLGDGQTRRFEERGTDYPNGLWRLVVPVRNVTGEVTGVVIISDSEVFSK